MTTQPKTNVLLRLDDEVALRLDAARRRRMVIPSRTEIARQALIDWLDRDEKDFLVGDQQQKELALK